MKPPKLNIVKKLVSIRKELGMTQSQLASRMGCTQGKISKLENKRDEDVSFGDACSYAKFVGCRIEIVLAEKNKSV